MALPTCLIITVGWTLTSFSSPPFWSHFAPLFLSTWEHFLLPSTGMYFQKYFLIFFGSFSTDFLLDRVCQLERRSNYLLRQARGLLSLSFILGSTWLIGVLGIFHSSIAVTYIFTTLNSLQGLFIFIFHVLWSDACRQVFRNFFQWFTEEDIKSSADITSVNRAGKWDIFGEFFKHYACLLLIEVSVYLYCLCSFYRIQMKNYCLIRPSFSFQKI